MFSIASGTTTDTSTPSLSDTTLGATSILTIGVTSTAAIATTDAYLIKMPASIDTAPAASSSAPTIGGSGTNTYKLPNLRWILIRPTTSIGAASNTVDVTGVVNPITSYDPSATLSFYAYHSQFDSYRMTKVTYTNPLSSTSMTPSTTFSGTGATFTASATNTNDLIDLTIKINNNFLSAQLITIQFPAQLTPSHLCREGVDSVVEVKTCSVSGQLATITINPKITYTNVDFVIKFSSVLTSSSAGAVSDFQIHTYWSTAATHASTDYIIYQLDSVSPSMTLTTPTIDVGPPDFFEWESLPYLSDVYPTANGRYGPLRFKIKFVNSVATTETIEITLGDALVADTTTNTVGDVTDNKLVCFITDGTTTYTASVAYTTNLITLSSFSSTLTSGISYTFIIQVQTQLMISGEVKTGLKVADITKYFRPKITVKNAGTGVQEAELEPFYPAVLPTSSFSFELKKVLSTNANIDNIMEFILTVGTSAIDTLIFEFPVSDDYGNSMWPADIAPNYANDQIIPCGIYPLSAGTVTVNGSATDVNYPVCRVSKGSSTGFSRSSTVTVSGISVASGNAFHIALTSIRNPTAAGTLVDVLVQAFTGSTTYVGSAYLRSAFQIQSLGTSFAPSSSNIITSDKPPLWTDPTTLSITPGVGVPVDNFIRIKLDPYCYLTAAPTSTVGNAMIMGEPGAEYVLLSVTSAVTASIPYTVSNIQCSKFTGVTFEVLHMNDDTSGELITSGISTGATTTATTLSGSFTITTNTETTGKPSALARVSVDLTGLAIGMSYPSIKAGYEMQLSITGYIFDTLTSCLVYGGFTQVNEDVPISCTISSGDLKITGFSGFTTPLLELGFTTIGSFTSGSIQARLYPPTSTTELVLDGTVGLTLAPSFTTATGTIEISASGLITTTGVKPGGESSSVTFTIPSPGTLTPDITSTTTEILVVRFENSAQILKSSTTCSVTDGTSTFSGTCTVDDSNQLIKLPFNNGVTLASLPAADITLTDTDVWPFTGSSVFANFEIYDDSDISTATRTHQSYTGYISLENAGSYTLAPADIVPLHLARSQVNEISFKFTAPVAMTTSYGIAIITTDITYPSTTSNYQIDCLCYLNGPSTVFNANCYSTSTSNTLHIFPQSSLASGVYITCYIPELTAGTSGTISFQYKIIGKLSGVSYYTSNTESFSTLPITTNAFTMTPNYGATNYGGSSILFSLSVTTPDALASGASIYLDLNKAGPVPTTATCPSGAPFSAARCYSLNKYIVVGILSAPVSSGGSVSFYSGTSMIIPSLLYDTSTPTYYTVSGFIASGTTYLASSTDYSSQFAASNIIFLKKNIDIMIVLLCRTTVSHVSD